MRKLAIKFVPPLAVTVVALVVLVGFLKDNSAYKKAGELASAGDYKAAIAAYQDLDDYKDSQDKILETTYAMAEAYAENGDYNRAHNTFVELGDYSDSADKAKDTVYRKAEALMGYAVSGSNDGRDLLESFSETAEKDKEAGTAEGGENSATNEPSSDEVFIDDASSDGSDGSSLAPTDEYLDTAEQLYMQLVDGGGYLDSEEKLEEIEVLREFGKSVTGGLDMAEGLSSPSSYIKDTVKKAEEYVPYCGSFSHTTEESGKINTIKSDFIFYGGEVCWKPEIPDGELMGLRDNGRTHFFFTDTDPEEMPVQSMGVDSTFKVEDTFYDNVGTAIFQEGTIVTEVTTAFGRAYFERVYVKVN